jgi:DNA invertase Pin-like site-specific DNA recombinase
VSGLKKVHSVSGQRFASFQMAAARSTLTLPTTSSTASNWPPTISPSLTFSRNRVSTSTQDQTRNWPSSNTHAGRFPINEFVEVQISSRKKPRQRGIDGVLERLAPGDQLIVNELSRLGRSLGRSLGQVIHIVDELVKRKIRFTAIKESIHFEGKQDLQTKVMVALFGLFAEVERDLISERTREGLASARVKGRLLGRPKGVLGKKVAAGWQRGRDPPSPAKAGLKGVHRQDCRRHSAHHLPLYQDKAVTPTSLKDIFSSIWSEP